MNSFKILGF